MSSSRNPSNRFENINPEQPAATGNDPMQVGSLSQALPAASGADKTRQGKKRPAPIFPPGFDLRADIKRRSMMPSDAPAATPPPSIVPSAQSTQVAKATPSPGFPYKEIPSKGPIASRCAFAFEGDDLVVGQVLSAPSNWEASVIIDADRYGYPTLTFQLKVAIDPQVEELTKHARYDLLSFFWHPATKSPTGQPMIAGFELKTFDDWYQESTRQAHKEAFHKEPGFAKLRNEVVMVKCLLQHAIIKTSFQDEESWAALPEGVEDAVTRLRDRPCTVRFWFRPRSTITRQHLPFFARRVAEKRGLLSQYWENGVAAFTHIEGSPSATDIGEGLYVRSDKTIATLPKVDVYREVKEFQAITCLTALREAQFTQARHLHLRGVPVGCFVKSIPKFAGSAGRQGEAGARIQQQIDMDESLYVYVRSPPGDEAQNAAPEAGLRVKLSWYNGDERLVSRDRSEFTATRTNYCIVLRPENKQMPCLPETTLRNMTGLPRAYIEVSYSAEPMQRELTAANLFSSERRKEIHNFRSLLMDGGRHNPATKVKTDLRLGVPASQEHVAHFESCVRDIMKGNRFNDSQLQVIEKLSNIEGNILAVAGPPGTGKTELMSLITYLCIVIGYKILVVAPSNQALDKIATETQTLAVAGTGALEFLRMEIASYEKSAILQDTADIDPSKPVPKDEALGVENDPRVLMAYADLLAEEADTRRFEELGEQLDAYKRDYEQVQRFKNLSVKSSIIPYKMTMGVKDENTTETAAERNPSKRYADFHADYLEREGRVGAEARKTFWKLRGQMESRVIKSQDVIYTTLNNAYRAAEFEPDLILIDEAGQASLPALFVPLTQFTSWKAAILAGDWKQLLPTNQSRRFSELGDNATVSALERFDLFQTHTLMLTEQYRMAESIAAFPSRHIYGGLLQTHPSAKNDHPCRQAVRRVSEQYGILPGTGSEYFFLDVHGTARREPNGTSLQNYANADAMDDVLTRLNAEGIQPVDIVVLSLYNGQVRHLQKRIGSHKCRNFNTTDSYQGQEADVIIVDFVAASEAALLGQTFHAADTEQAENDDGKYKRVSSFAKDFHRINFAITRAKHGLILIGQEALLARTMDQAKGPLANTMFHMILDLDDRKLVHHSDLVDSHPDAIAQREKNMALARAQHQALETKKSSLGFIQAILWRGRQAQQEQVAKSKAGSPITIEDINVIKARRQARQKHKAKPVIPKSTTRQPWKPVSLPQKPPTKPPGQGRGHEGNDEEKHVP
ncbi:MAG: hypothetical protein Q9211_002917 [Gyalolechia sp. 1 TL-2023]